VDDGPGTTAAALGGERRAASRLEDRVVRAWGAGDTAAVDEVLDALARASGEGSPIALELLVGFVDRLALTRGPIRQILIGEEDVADAHQRVLIAVSRGIGSFSGASRFRTWLFSVARNEALQVLRSGRRVPWPSDAVEERGGEFVARMSSLVTDREVIQQVLRALPEPFRTAVVLRDVEELEYGEIADRLGVALGTVKSRINRGRAIAAAQLQELV
jgi:RNA polymerase sigma-70 factor (ECF subfamily)